MVIYELLEPRIVIYRWQDRVDMREAKAALLEAMPAVDSTGYVAIVDMHAAKNIPTQIGQLVENVKIEVQNGLHGYVLFGASTIVESFLRAISRLAPTKYKIAHTWDEAISLARDLLPHS